MAASDLSEVEKDCIRSYVRSRGADGASVSRVFELSSYRLAQPVLKPLGAEASFRILTRVRNDWQENELTWKRNLWLQEQFTRCRPVRLPNGDLIYQCLDTGNKVHYEDYVGRYRKYLAHCRCPPAVSVVTDDVTDGSDSEESRASSSAASPLESSREVSSIVEECTLVPSPITDLNLIPVMCEKRCFDQMASPPTSPSVPVASSVHVSEISTRIRAYAGGCSHESKRSKDFGSLW